MSCRDRYHDPDWRRRMPWRWRMQRWWYINKPAMYATLIIVAAVVALAWLLWLATLGLMG